MRGRGCGASAERRSEPPSSNAPARPSLTCHALGMLADVLLGGGPLGPPARMKIGAWLGDLVKVTGKALRFGLRSPKASGPSLWATIHVVHVADVQQHAPGGRRVR